MLSEGLIMVSREKQESYRRVETSRSVKVWSSFRIIIPGIPEDLFLSWSGLEWSTFPIFLVCLSPTFVRYCRVLINSTRRQPSPYWWGKGRTSVMDGDLCNLVCYWLIQFSYTALHNAHVSEGLKKGVSTLFNPGFNAQLSLAPLFIDMGLV